MAESHMFQLSSFKKFFYSTRPRGLDKINSYKPNLLLSRAGEKINSVVQENSVVQLF